MLAKRGSIRAFERGLELLLVAGWGAEGDVSKKAEATHKVRQWGVSFIGVLVSHRPKGERGGVLQRFDGCTLETVTSDLVCLH